MYNTHHSRAKMYLALALAAMLCFAFSFSPLASVRAEEEPPPAAQTFDNGEETPEELAAGDDSSTPEATDPTGEDGADEDDGGQGEDPGGEEPDRDGDDAPEEENTGEPVPTPPLEEDEDDVPAGEEPPQEDESGPEGLDGTDETHGGTEGPQSDIDAPESNAVEPEQDGLPEEEETEDSEDDEEEAEEDEEDAEEDEPFAPPEYDPQPATADEAMAMWEAAIADGRQVMWEFELDEELVPEGMRQEFVLLDEESGIGFWTLYMDFMALAALNRTITSEAQLRKAINDAAADDVLTLTIANSFSMNDTITIDKSLTVLLVAGSNVELTMVAADTRHFTVAAGNAELYLENVVLSGRMLNELKGYTGGIHVAAGATARVEGALLEDCAMASTMDHGGALYVEGTLTLADTTIRKADAWRNGGAIYVAPGGALTIDGTAQKPVVISASNATQHGGAIYIEAGGRMEASYLHITSGLPSPDGTGAEVGGRTGIGYGGGIYWDIAAGTGTQALANSIIEDCVTPLSGAGVYINVQAGGTLTSFNGNVIRHNLTTSPLGFGGAMTLINNGSVGAFTGNTFSESVAANGAGLTVQGSAGLTITDSVIENNDTDNNSLMRSGTRSIRSGAGLYSANASLTIAGSNTKITKNRIDASTGNGGGVYVAAGTTILAEGGVTGNTAENLGGGVLVDAGGVFRQTGGSIDGNTAGFGGGVYILAGGEARLTGGSIAGNETVGGGLGVFSFGTLTIGGDVKITGHSADGRNGAVMLGTDSTATMSGGSIYGNTLTSNTSGTAVGNGAGIYVNTNATLTMTGGEIYENEAVRGAAIYAHSNATVNISGGTLRDNVASQYGGAIFLQDDNTLTINAQSATAISGNKADAGGAIYSLEQNSIALGENGGGLSFNGNGATAAYYGGGAIYLAKGTLTMGGGSFTNNTAAGDGAAVYLFGGTAKATFTGGRLGASGNGNSAAGDGGAIFNSKGTLIIGGDTFIGYNEAANNGGGVSSTYGANRFEGEDTGGPEVSHNTALNGDGGGVYVSNGTLGMLYTTLEDNTARYGGGAYVAVGGLLDGGGSDVIEKLEHNTFHENTARLDGGGMFVLVSASGVSESISDNKFLSNRAEGNGGGLYVQYYGTGKRVAGNQVEGNTAGGNGGGLYVEGTMQRYFAITTDKVINNTADGNGGGIYVDNTILRVYNTGGGTVAEIAGNKAANGGAIYAAGYAKVIVEQGDITDNKALTGSGGAIYSNVYLADASLLSEKGADGTTNTGTKQYEDVLVAVDVATLSGNEALSGNGGGIYIGQRGGLTLSGTTLKNNKAVNGGAVYLATFGELVIQKDDEGKGNVQPEITGNTATQHGGGLYVGNGTLTLEYAKVTANKAENGNGGGAYVTLMADAGGGGEAQQIIYNLFKDNQAENGNGGGLYISIKDGAISKVIAENDFDHNIALGDGGGAWISFEGEGRSVYDNTVQNNEARRGGGMYVTGTSKGQNNMSITTDRIINNTASYAGGGIMVENSTFVLFNTDAVGTANKDQYLMLNGDPISGQALVAGNKAPNGGGIYLANSTLYVMDGRLENNTATTGNGGGIYATGDSVIKNYDPYGVNPVFGLEIVDNTAAENGGGMYLVPQQDYRLAGLLVQGNEATAGDGGGIYVNKSLLGKLYLTDSVFGSPGENPGDTGLFNKAGNPYVVGLSDADKAAFDSIHASQLVSLTGLSPDGTDWATSTSSAPYYNNYDIAFFSTPDEYITVTYHANTGYFFNDHYATEHSDMGTTRNPLPNDTVAAPEDPRHTSASFIGWFNAPYTAENILENARTANVDLNRLGTNPDKWEYEVTQTTANVDFYAAWLPAPKVGDVYDNFDYDNEVVTVTALPGATSATLWVGDTLGTPYTGTRQADGTTWEFTLPTSETLTAKTTQLYATQTITVASDDGSPITEYEVESPRAIATVLPTYRVVYHINADSETPAEQNRLETDWLPKDLTSHRSDADHGVSTSVLPPAAGEPGRAGYVFLGWQEENSAKLLNDYSDPAAVTLYDDDVHLYAQWERQVTLTYDANTGDSSLDGVLPDGEETKAGARVGINPWKQTDYAGLRDEYRFAYWTSDRAGNDTAHYLDAGALADAPLLDSVPLSTEITLNQDRVLYAKWLPLYQVVYNLNYFGAPESPVKDDNLYAVGDSFDVPNTIPQRQGYTFLGWHYYQNAAQDDTLWFHPGNTYSLLEQGYTLYAQWTPTIYPPVVTKDSGEDWLEPGDSFTYTITVYNRSTETVEAELTDTLPDGLQYVGGDPAPDAQNGQELVWQKTMDGGELWTILVDVTLDDGYTANTLHNTARAVFNADDDLAGEGDDTINVVQPPTNELVPPIVRKTSGLQAITPGDDFTYTITVYNNSLKDVEAAVTDTLPAGLTLRSTSPTATQTGGALVWQKPMGPLETWEIKVHVTLDEDFAGDSLHNLATATFNDDDDLTSSGEDTTIVLPPPAELPVVEKTASVNKVQPGDTFSYTIAVHNTSGAAVSAVATDTLPEGLTYTGGDAPYEQDGQTLRWRAVLQPGESWGIVVQVTLDRDFTGQSIHNVAVATFNDDAGLTADGGNTIIVEPPGPGTPGGDPLPPGRDPKTPINPGEDPGGQIDPEPPADPGSPKDPAAPAGLNAREASGFAYDTARTAGDGANEATSGSAIVATGDSAEMMFWMRVAFIAFAVLCLLLAGLSMYRQRRHMKRYNWYYRM